LLRKLPLKTYPFLGVVLLRIAPQNTIFGDGAAKKNRSRDISIFRNGYIKTPAFKIQFLKMVLLTHPFLKRN
jgi:hypothetical protein